MCSNMSSQLLELAACDDLVGFTRVVEEEGCDIDGVGLWYGMRIGTKKMGLVERTPLMIAAMFGSLHVLSYILEKDCVDVNRICGSDGATALHCAIAGGAATASQVVKLLIDASADCNLVGAYTSNLDALIARVARVANILKPFYGAELASDPFDQELRGEEDRLMDMGISATEPSRDYPIDLSLPDIKNGVFSTDEFRMYSFKIRPCSRAYSHDWTECPFVHPGENARRRDPRKHHYSCVPCPEFRKGACHQGDACEYAHGIFECWLHPAQYRTRLCKDETGCNRRVCFFAHKPEELRPLYASTGSAIPSPRSYTPSGQLDMSSLSPLHLGSPSSLIPSTSTPTGLSSPRSGPMWQNQSNAFASNPLAYNSRLKSTLSARDMDFDTADQHSSAEFQHRQQQHLMDEMYGFYSPCSRNQPFESNSPAARVGEFNHLMGRKSDDMFASVDHSVMSQLKCLSVDVNHQLRASYPTNLSSSPARSTSFGIDPSRSSSATAYLNLRSTAFTKRSQSFIERSPTNQNSGFSSPVSSASSLHGWGSPTGKLDWGVQGKELNKLRKSASFGIRSNGRGSTSSISGEPEMCWASPRMKDTLPLDRLDEEQYHLNSGGSGNIPTWVEQMYLDQEQTVAH